MSLGSYVGIGGGATPFIPALELSAILTPSLSHHCFRHTNLTRLVTTPPPLPPK